MTSIYLILYVEKFF